MCIIVVKNKEVKAPDFEILKNCFENNPDGAGFMYNYNDKVVINKGYMDFDCFKKALEEVYEKVDLNNTAFVYHFRIGTSGTNSPENTHPYPMVKNIDFYKKLNIETDVAVAHNGVISKYAPDIINKRNMNDTQLFIYKYLYKFNYNKSYKLDKIKQNILDISNSKFAIMDASGEVELIGSFVENEGIYYSNTSYIKYTYDYFNNYNTTFGYDELNLKFKNFKRMGEFLDKVQFISTNNIIYTETDELYPVSDYQYFIDDYALYEVDFDNKICYFITDFYEVVNNSYTSVIC